MSQVQTALQSTENNEVFLPPPYEQPHVRRQFDDLMREVSDVIAPVWPLKDYVAVNPYAGVSERPFMEARALLKVFSDCETLMPLDFFARQFEQGRFSIHEIDAAIEELRLAGIGGDDRWSAISIVEQLRSILGKPGRYAAATIDPTSPTRKNPRMIRTLSEYADGLSTVNWSDTIRDEVGKCCAAHYDEGQAAWNSPWKHLSLYQAWRSTAVIDLNVEALGLTGFRKFVSELPHSPDAAIVSLLQSLNLPLHLWEPFLLAQAFSIPGWSAWAKYQSSWNDQAAEDNNDLVGLLAMRLAYDVAIGQQFSISVNWNSITAHDSATFQASTHQADDDSGLRYLLLRASEIAYRNGLLNSISAASHPAESSQTAFASHDSTASQTDRKLAQMVFCIDVRSERMRRNLESQSSEIETFGFAGFFGMPIEFVPIGERCGNSHVPVLLKPQFQLHEGLHESDSSREPAVIKDRQQIRSWRTLWRGFQSSAVGCFSFVETMGLLYGWKLFAKAAGSNTASQEARFDGIAETDHDKLGPTLRGLNQQGITTSQQADLAESMLKNLGLTRDFARLVVFCGHASQTDNNPLAAGLDCGACGGHSGEPNARLAAMLLNQPYIRKALANRGITIPEGTHFLAGLHNTTTDRIEYFDLDDVPETHRGDVEELASYSDFAAAANSKRADADLGQRFDCRLDATSR